MMETNNPLAPYQADCLWLLIGGNPLPNAVAAQLLAAPQAVIWLLHTDGAEGEPGTKKTAENLERFLRQINDQWRIALKPIPSSDSGRIEACLEKLLGDNDVNGRIGLHYTGGTKSMSVHAYRFLEKKFANAQSRPIFSYLDPRRLALRIDGYGAEKGQTFYISKIDQLRQKIAVSDLDQLAALHDYQPAAPDEENWAETDSVFALAKAMVEVFTDVRGCDEWARLRQQWRKIPVGQDFNLPNPQQFPALKPLSNAFDNLCGGAGQATPSLVAQYLRPGADKPTLRSCSKWLLGVWLELYAKKSFLALPADLHISYTGTNLCYKNQHKKSDKFELDLAAIIGYQIFAISCIGTAEKGKAKEHFLEVYVRARQLGGDEARAGLICLLDNPAELQSQVGRSWDADSKVRVFGRYQLKDLEQQLADWLGGQ